MLFKYQMNIFAHNKNVSYWLFPFCIFHVPDKMTTTRLSERFGSIDTLGLMDGRIQYNHKVAKWRPNNAQIHACWLCAY